MCPSKVVVLVDVDLVNGCRYSETYLVLFSVPQLQIRCYCIESIFVSNFYLVGVYDNRCIFGAYTWGFFRILKHLFEKCTRRKGGRRGGQGKFQLQH